uniref:Olfactomedin-like 3a n=1 Tax=Astyanax mexicanus TaxID=7994 RepID=A0A8B9JHW3_ASTMX
MKSGFLFSLLLSFLILISDSEAQYHYQGLMNYLESRMVAMEVMIIICFPEKNTYAVYNSRVQTSDLLSEFKQRNTNYPHHNSFLLKMAASSVGSHCPFFTLHLNPDLFLMFYILFYFFSVCMDLVSSIRAMKILKRVGSPKGIWTKDARTAKVYIFNGTSEDTLYEFNSREELSTSTGLSKGKQITLPSVWNGTGHAVYDGFLYYVSERSELQVVKYDLKNGSVTDSAVLPVEAQTPVYSLNPETTVDLIADEEGLWALYPAGNTINLAKMDPETLDIEQMWDTSCPRNNAEAAFMVCGTVYVVYNTRPSSRSRIQCVYDVADMVTNDEAPLLYFPRRYGAHSSLKYNPAERQLYGWDDGYQILYRLALKKKLWAIAPLPEE